LGTFLWRDKEKYHARGAGTASKANNSTIAPEARSTYQTLDSGFRRNDGMGKKREK
jgi:hypothetical protein